MTELLLTVASVFGLIGLIGLILVLGAIITTPRDYMPKEKCTTCSREYDLESMVFIYRGSVCVSSLCQDCYHRSTWNVTNHLDKL